jgi:hypothetical protein
MRVWQVETTCNRFTQAGLEQVLARPGDKHAALGPRPARNSRLALGR